MSLYQEPRDTLLNLLEKENNIVLDHDDYDFSTPVPATPPEGSTASYNTTLTVSSNNPAAPYIGSVDIYYNRLDLADLKVLADIYVYSSDVTSTHGVLPSLNRRYGLNLKTTDVEDIASVVEDGYRTVTLRALPDSLGWIGELQVGVIQGDLPLEEHVTETTLGGLSYPSDNPDLTYAYFYSYWRDYSDYHDELVSVVTGDAINLTILSALNEVTGDPWVTTGPGEFSLADATISYAGTTDAYLAANSDYTHVIVIQLSTAQCTNMTGELYLHHTADPYATMGI